MLRLESGWPHRKLLGQLLWFLLWAASTVVLLWLTPDVRGHGTHQQLGLPPCPTVALMGRPCPGCGLTTSVAATLHGQVFDALRAHPMGPLLYVGFTLSAIVSLYAYAKGLRWNTNKPSINWTLGVFVGSLLVYGFARFLLESGWSIATR